MRPKSSQKFVNTLGAWTVGCGIGLLAFVSANGCRWNEERGGGADAASSDGLFTITDGGRSSGGGGAGGLAVVATGGVAGGSGLGHAGSGGTVAESGGTSVVGKGGNSAPGGALSFGGGSGSDGSTSAGGASGRGGATGAGGASGTGGSAPGNPAGNCPIPVEAQLEDVSNPTTVVGKGTPATCTGEEFISAVARSGIITFNCGADPVTITLTAPAKVFNDKGPQVVIDGGGKITLSGGGTTRILYMNTCDENQVWTTPHCDNQETPQLTVQNLTFINGHSKNETKYDGGGAIYASGGRLKIINSRFTNNACADTGPDVGGGAVRAFQQYNGLPVYVVASTFGGANGLGNVGSNGGALSSIGVSWTVINTLISYNHAIGNGGNPATAGTPGGGSGGGIYNDGDTMTLTLCGTRLEYNQVNAFGSAIFFVSNNSTGNIVIDSSTITSNVGGSWYPQYPQISAPAGTPITATKSTIR